VTFACTRSTAPRRHARARRVWEGWPGWPRQPTRVHALEHAGASAADKLRDLRGGLSKEGADAILLNDLAEIAWLFNMRGADVDCNPVFVAYAAVAQESATLYIHKEQVVGDVASHLKEAGVDVAEYNEVRRVGLATSNQEDQRSRNCNVECLWRYLVNATERLSLPMVWAPLVSQ
jgi:Xaa-Pro aminopeptidase